MVAKCNTKCFKKCKAQSIKHYNSHVRTFNSSQSIIVVYSTPITNFCDLGFGHSKFHEIPEVYNAKDFCYGDNCQSTLTKVYCDTLTAGGGWTVTQRKLYGIVEFIWKIIWKIYSLGIYVYVIMKLCKINSLSVIYIIKL